MYQISDPVSPSADAERHRGEQSKSKQTTVLAHAHFSLQAAPARPTTHQHYPEPGGRRRSTVLESAFRVPINLRHELSTVFEGHGYLPLPDGFPSIERRCYIGCRIHFLRVQFFGDISFSVRLCCQRRVGVVSFL